MEFYLRNTVCLKLPDFEIGIGVTEGVHTEALDPRLITKFVKVGIIGTILCTATYLLFLI